MDTVKIRLAVISVAHPHGIPYHFGANANTSLPQRKTRINSHSWPTCMTVIENSGNNFSVLNNVPYFIGSIVPEWKRLGRTRVSLFGLRGTRPAETFVPARNMADQDEALRLYL
jgi:hypothetical protein